MSGPRHLWSGDWESESSAHAGDLAARRGHAPEEPAAPEPAVPSPRPNRLGMAIRALREHLRHIHWRRFRVAFLAGLLTLVVVGAAYAVTENLGGATGPQPVAASGSEAWLGVDLTNSGSGGAMVTRVAPGSPAAAAGIKPGDVITQLDTEPIVTPAIFVSAISGLQPGDRVDVQLQRGSSQYTAQVVLANRPASSP